ncbi:MAG: 50S ribosomal protein L1 [Candidatus Woesebacteria bacterium]|nr:50S ribosomal protein L1 [Candidatus Woesebacteria bacterium]
MGKTKTAFVKEVKDETKRSSFEELKEKRAKQAEEKIHIAGLKGGQRVKIIEAEQIITTEEIKKEEEEKAKKAPRIRGKKYNEVKAKVDRNKSYPVKEAIKLVKETSYSKFDGSVELHMVIKKLGLSASVTLPHSAGKEKRVEIASDETIKKLELGKIDFDILIATPDMMPKLVPFAKVLGPKGLMPNPKNGTLVPDIKKAKSVGGNTITIKTEKEAPLIHTVIGKVSQKEEELEENLAAIIKAISEKQVEKAYLKATMGPSVRLKI